MSKVAVIGATTWGNTIGRLLANKGLTVSIWAKTEARAREFSREQRHFPSTAVQETFTHHADLALKGAEFVIWGVPAQSVRQTAKHIGNHNLTGDMIHISLAKGLEANTCKRMSEVMVEELPLISPKRVCVLSGPNLSGEINRGLPATSVLASGNASVSNKAQALFNSPNFAVFTSTDLIGVELCGALKNVIALGAGMVDGLGLGDNAKSTFITMGWAEVTSLGKALGAKPHTFYGLAGMGDLITTCAGPMSRNHFVGREVALGRPLAEVKAAMSNVAEGIETSVAAHKLSAGMKLNVPIIDLIYRVLFEYLPPVEITNQFKDGLKPGFRA
jgi:glycerol-3-phosphate dehydrogenase (NAD(P)+)